MILLADSGSTKTDWCVMGHGCETVRLRTAGINVSVMSAEDVRRVVAEVAAKMTDASEGISRKSLIPEAVSEIHFYAAGLVGGDAAAKLTGALKAVFRNAETDADTDLMAAARALWGDCPGVAAILGTGSNSCLYDGRRIVKNVHPGGFVLGDEGGGAALGRMLLSDFIKGLMPEEIISMLQESGLDYPTIVTNVYKSANPAAYLASFAPFVFDNIDSPYLRGLVEENFRAFVRRSLSGYRDVGNAAKASEYGVTGGVPEVCAAGVTGEGTEPLKVGVVGSVACAGKEILSRVAREEGVEISRFLKSPMDGLIEYYNDER